MSGQQSLVSGDDRNALVERAQDQGARGFDAADQFDDEVHAIDGLGRVGGQQLAVDRGVARGIHIADEDAPHLHFSARASSEILTAGLQDTNDLATNGSSSKNANSEDGTGCRHRTFSPLWDGHCYQCRRSGSLPSAEDLGPTI